MPDQSGNVDTRLFDTLVHAKSRARTSSIGELLRMFEGGPDPSPLQSIGVGPFADQVPRGLGDRRDSIDLDGDGVVDMFEQIMSELKSRRLMIDAMSERVGGQLKHVQRTLTGKPSDPGQRAPRR